MVIVTMNFLQVTSLCVNTLTILFRDKSLTFNFDQWLDWILEIRDGALQDFLLYWQSQGHKEL